MTLARSYKTNAIVLRARNLGEADKILTLLTDRSGKLDAVAKGIRRGKSHYGGRLEFGNECALTMHRGRSLDVIVSAEILRAPWEQLVEPERFAVATFAVELVDAFCEPDLAVPEIYALLRGMLAGVASGEHPHALVPRFSLRLLGELGLAPPMHDCVRCGVPLAAPAWLDAQDGGFVGIECREKWRELPEFDAGRTRHRAGIGRAARSGRLHAGAPAYRGRRRCAGLASPWTAPQVERASRGVRLARDRHRPRRRK